VEPIAKTLMLFGGLLVLVGLALYFAPSIPMLGKLPGDIRIERPGGRFYFPITTCLLLSAVISAVLILVSKLR
jgi:hypothetical protein